MRERIQQKVKREIEKLAPDATIILFGSHARGDAGLESDWDFLVLLENLGPALKNQILDELFEITLETGEAVVPLFRTKQEWNSELLRATPFHDEVVREGIAV